jgi:hypothetical protein
LTVEASAYEHRLVALMRKDNLTLLEAMSYDMEIACIDVSSVLGICDYLEEQLGDLNKVEYYMMIYTGQALDIELKRT